MKAQQGQRFLLVFISNMFFIVVCFYSGINGHLQDLLSSVMLLWLLFISSLLIIFYEPNNKDIYYKRFHDNIAVIKMDNSNFKFILLRLIMTITNYNLTHNINWLLIMGCSYGLIPLILFKQMLSRK